MTIKNLLLTAPLLLAPAFLMAQGKGVAPADLLKPLRDSWPTYNGDYSGKRYQRPHPGQPDQRPTSHARLDDAGHVGRRQCSGGGGRGGRAAAVSAAPRTSLSGGEGPGDIAVGGGTIKASALQVDGTLYFTMPDNAWAVDARDGRELWHYFWKTKGGTHIGNRGLAMWNNYLYMETPDDYLVSLDARTGKERWHKEIADLSQGYFSTPAPIVVGNHVLVGTGNDIDAPGFLQSFDPETGELQWKLYTVPMKAGDPGSRNVGQSRRRPSRRRADLDSRRLRSRDQTLHLRHRQPHPRIYHGHARRGRQPLHLRAGRRQCGYRQDGLAFLHLAARHARLRFRADPGSGGRHVQRQDAQAGPDRGAQRLLLHARSRHRRTPGDQPSTAWPRTGPRA